jgi:hypothetical protein
MTFILSNETVYDVLFIMFWFSLISKLLLFHKVSCEFLNLFLWSETVITILCNGVPELIHSVRLYLLQVSLLWKGNSSVKISYVFQGQLLKSTYKENNPFYLELFFFIYWDDDTDFLFIWTWWIISTDFEMLN